jgi:hypothetical protein
MKARAVEEDHPTTESQVEEDLERLEEELAAAKELISEPATISVRRMYKDTGELVGDPEEEDAVIEVLDFVTEPARTGTRTSVTLNMGNYWSLSVQVSVSVPCYREEIDGAAKFASQFTEQRLTEEIEKGKVRVSQLRKKKGAGQGLF